MTAAASGMKLFFGGIKFSKGHCCRDLTIALVIIFLPWQPNQRHSAWTVKIDTITDFYNTH